MSNNLDVASSFVDLSVSPNALPNATFPGIDPAWFD
jgi:hypothetical protein